MHGSFNNLQQILKTEFPMIVKMVFSSRRGFFQMQKDCDLNESPQMKIGSPEGVLEILCMARLF